MTDFDKIQGKTNKLHWLEKISAKKLKVLSLQFEMNADERLFRFGEYNKKSQGGYGKGSKNQNGKSKWHLPNCNGPLGVLPFTVW